jgi:hypothetical protein
MADDPNPPSRQSRDLIRAAAGFVLVLFITVIGLMYANKTQPTLSTMDGAKLPGFPTPAASTVIGGEWMKSVETWMDDRIVGRQYWLSLHAKISMSALRVRELNNITVDRRTNMQLEKPGPLPPNPKLGDYAASLGDSIRAAGAVPLFVYIPRKEEVFSDLLPQAWPNTYLEVRPTVLRDLRRGGNFLDLTPVLADPNTRFANYWLTDHHWAPPGTLRGLAAISDKLATLGVKLGPSPAYHDVQYKEFFGSYARRITAAGSPVGDKFIIPTPAVWHGRLCGRTGPCKSPFFVSIANSKDLYANRYAAFLGGDVGYQQLINDSPDAKGTIVILKDSYGLPLVTYLAQKAHRVVAIDERKYKGEELRSLFKKIKPDAVLVVHNTRTLLGDSTFDPKLWVDAAAVIAAR